MTQTSLFLKPCPFCGGNAAILGISADGRYVGTPGAVVRGEKLGKHIALCSGCGARTKIFFYAWRAQAAWNKRKEVLHERE